MLFSEYVLKIKGEKLQEGVAEKFNELQANNKLEAIVLLSGQAILTEHYLEYNDYISQLNTN